MHHLKCPFSSLLFSSHLSSLPFPSLIFSSLFSSLLFSSFVFSFLAFPSLASPSLPFPSLLFSSLLFPFFLFSSLLYENSLLSNCQSGFRSLHSTLTALIEATNDWSINIDRGNLNGVVFIDLKKAFDTIDHEIILRKLTCYGFDTHTLKWFESYFSNRYQKCNVNGHLSNPLPVTCGVPQDSIIGCLLFLIYINDLPSCLSVGSPRMFADDTNITFVAGTTSELESLINIELQNLNQWLQANRLSLNIAKTEFMIIISRQKQLTNTNNLINIKIENNRIKRVASAKSLGVTVDERLSWDKHIDEK